MAALSRQSKKDDEDEPRGVEAAGTDPSNATAIDAEPVATEATIKIADHKVSVDVKNAPKDETTTVAELSAQDLEKLQKQVMEERARRANAVDRPFESVDTESLLVIANQVRGELASR